MADAGVNANTLGMTATAQTLKGAGDAAAGLYAEFGGRTGFDVGQNARSILGGRDPAHQLPGPDVVDAWANYCEQWGQLLDQATGVIYAMAEAMDTSSDLYKNSDGAAAGTLASTDPAQQAFARADGNLGAFGAATIGTAPQGTPGPLVPTAPNRGSTASAETNRFGWLTTKVNPQQPTPPTQAG